MARKNWDLKCAYIFPDGHAVLKYEVPEPKAQYGRIEVVEVIQHFCKSRFRGRIVIHDTGILAALKGARMVAAKPPALENGSENSKAKGFPMGYLSINNSYGHLAFYEIPGIFGGGYTYQPEETWEEEFGSRVEGNLWCDMKIVKIHHNKPLD